MINTILNILNQFNNKWVALLQVMQITSIIFLTYGIYKLDSNISTSIKKIESRFILEDRTFLDNQIQVINFDREDIKLAELDKAKILCLTTVVDIYYQDKCKTILQYIEQRR